MAPRATTKQSSSAVLKKFGDRVRELRTSKHWSQSQLSEKTKSYPSHVNAIEHGRQNVTLQTVEELAQALGVSLRDLF